MVEKINLINIIKTIVDCQSDLGLVYLADYSKWYNTISTQFLMELEYEKQSKLNFFKQENKIQNFQFLLKRLKAQMIRYERSGFKENPQLGYYITIFNSGLERVINDNLTVLNYDKISKREIEIMQNDILVYKKFYNELIEKISIKTSWLKNSDTLSLNIVKKFSKESLENLDKLKKPATPDFTFQKNLINYTNYYNSLKSKDLPNYNKLYPNIEVKTGGTSDENISLLHLLNLYSEFLNSSNNSSNFSTKSIHEFYVNNKPNVGLLNTSKNIKRAWNLVVVDFDQNLWLDIPSFQEEYLYYKIIKTHKWLNYNYNNDINLVNLLNIKDASKSLIVSNLNPVNDIFDLNKSEFSSRLINDYNITDNMSIKAIRIKASLYDGLISNPIDGNLKIKI